MTKGVSFWPSQKSQATAGVVCIIISSNVPKVMDGFLLLTAEVIETAKQYLPDAVVPTVICSFVKMVHGTESISQLSIDFFSGQLCTIRNKETTSYYHN